VARDRVIAEEEVDDVSLAFTRRFGQNRLAVDPGRSLREETEPGVVLDAHAQVEEVAREQAAPVAAQVAHGGAGIFHGARSERNETVRGLVTDGGQVRGGGRRRRRPALVGRVGIVVLAVGSDAGGPCDQAPDSVLHPSRKFRLGISFGANNPSWGCLGSCCGGDSRP
jgi:hypothetical protein